MQTTKHIYTIKTNQCHNHVNFIDIIKKSKHNYNFFNFKKNNNSTSLRKLAYTLVVLLLNFTVSAQTNDCDDNAGGEITPGSSCNFTTMNSDNNTNYWNGASGCSAGDNDDVWAWFVATSTSTTITYDPITNKPAILTLLTGACSPTMGSLACANAGGNGVPETIVYATTVGTTYRIRVQREGGDQTLDGQICVYGPTCNDGIQNGTETGIDCGGTCAPCAPIPLNDDCSGAITLACGDNISGSTNQSVPTPHGTACSMSDDGSWYTFVGDGNNTTINVTATSGWDHEINISSGSCGSFTNITCQDDGFTDGTESYSFLTVIGTTYYLYIGYYGSGSGTTGDFDISRDCTVPGVCTSDMTINTTTYSQTGLTTCGFGDDYSSSDACGSSYMNGDDIVIEYIPTTTECVTIALTNTDTWTGIFITDGCPDDPSTICIDNSTNSSGNPEINSLDVVAGTSYYITISTNPSPQCTAFDLNITTCPTPTCSDGVQNGTETGIDCGGDTCPDCPSATVEDCAGGTTICTDEVISGNSSGSGLVNDLSVANQGCLGSENQSSWYYFQAATGGDIELTITTTVDYDFAIWGPYTGDLDCPPGNTPLRCSFGGTAGDTGLAIGSGDTSEDSDGDEFVDEINATTGDAFIMLIDNYTSDGSSFTLDWTLSAGATLDCTILPVIFSDFHITKLNNSNLLNWNTYSEINNDYFKIQILEENNEFYTIGMIDGQNNSSEITPYVFEHSRPEKKINIYRVIQVDYNGKETIYSTKTVNNSDNLSEVIGTFNLLGQKVESTYVGIVIKLYIDGTTTKFYQNNQ